VSERAAELSNKLYELWGEWAAIKYSSEHYYDYIARRLIEDGWVQS
jgi:hypothetical protein